MMNYEEFKNALVNAFDNVELYEAKKNNVAKDAMRKKEVKVSPMVYIEDWYNVYERDNDFVNIISSINNIFEATTPSEFDLDFDNLNPDNLTARLVNYDKNAERLENIVHERILDLAVELRYIVSNDDNGISTFAVTNDILDKMGISKEEAFAKVKARLKRESVFSSMLSVMMGMGIGLPIESFDEPMYVLSNKAKVNGAISIYNTDILDKIMDDMELDEMFIIPSSIHEVLIINTNLIEVDELENIIRTVNTDILKAEEFLSDRAYKYTKADGLQFA